VAFGAATGRQVRGGIRALAPGELLFQQSDPAAAIYKVESGRLCLIRAE